MSADAPLLDAEPGRGKALDVVGVGECSLDTVAVVDALPAPGAKVSILERRDVPGGQMATAMLACARLGLRSGLISAVGDDAAGDAVRTPLRSAGVALDCVRSVAGAATRTALVLVDERTGERTVVGHRDPRLSLDPGTFSREAITRARILHVDATDPDLSLWAARVAQQAGIAVVLDADAPGPAVDALLREVDFPIVSYAFAEETTDARDPAECIRRLVARGARFAVVTLGEKGAMAGGEGGEVLSSGGFPVAVRDTTGAGDVFHAGFIYALLRGLPAEEVLRTANAAAAMCCRALGAQGGLPTEAELQGFVASRGKP